MQKWNILPDALNTVKLAIYIVQNITTQQNHSFRIHKIFICTVKVEWLDGKHVVFGNVVEGMVVIKKIEGFGSRTGKTSKKILIEECGEIV